VALMEATEESGGEGYFASVSDMMVGILFIFLLLLTVFALNFRDAEQEQKAKLEDLIRAEKRATEAEDQANEATGKGHPGSRGRTRAVAGLTAAVS